MAMRMRIFHWPTFDIGVDGSHHHHSGLALSAASSTLHYGEGAIGCKRQR